ncbi:glycosyltransferase family 4 protein [Pontibacter sp. CAU 1760]
MGYKIIEVYHFYNGKGGGVLSVIQNIIKHSNNPLVKHHVLHILNETDFSNYNSLGIEGAWSEKVFYYNPKSNYYHNCKRLVKLLPDYNAVVVAHDWFELGMITNLGLQNPAVQFLHGDYDYYYQLAQRHKESIDRFITVSKNIHSKLCSYLPNQKPFIYHCRFPVRQIISTVEKQHTLLKVFYCVRRLDDINKQFEILPLIDKKLRDKGIIVEWKIVGDGLSTMEREQIWVDKNFVTYYHRLSNDEVSELLPTNDIFILPSIREGFPVTLVEAMKAGLVPLITNWAGATNELILPGKTGYYFEVGDADAYASQIAVLHNDRTLLKSISVEGQKLSNVLFDPFSNVTNIEDVLVDAFEKRKKNKLAYKVYGSLLDQLWLPNIITRSLRSVLPQRNR